MPEVVFSAGVRDRWPGVEAALEDPDPNARSASRPTIHVIGFTELFHGSHGGPPIVIGPDDPQRFVEAVERGIVGYVPEPPDTEELRAALMRAADGAAYVPPHLLGTLLRHTVERNRERRARLRDLEQLTLREREVADLIATGLGRKDVAVRLGISPATVRTHLQRIMTKLGVHSQNALMALLHGEPVERTPSWDADGRDAG